MERKHTKGNWDYEDNIIFPKGLSSNIATVQFRTNKEETEANAKLIAAAPDLLEALIEAKNAFEYSRWTEETYKLIDNVIKKATE